MRRYKVYEYLRLFSNAINFLFFKDTDIRDVNINFNIEIYCHVRILD